MLIETLYNFLVPNWPHISGYGMTIGSLLLAYTIFDYFIPIRNLPMFMFKHCLMLAAMAVTLVSILMVTIIWIGVHLQ